MGDRNQAVRAALDAYAAKSGDKSDDDAYWIWDLFWSLGDFCEESGLDLTGIFESARSSRGRIRDKVDIDAVVEEVKEDDIVAVVSVVAVTEVAP